MLGWSFEEGTSLSFLSSASFFLYFFSLLVHSYSLYFVYDMTCLFRSLSFTSCNTRGIAGIGVFATREIAKGSQLGIEYAGELLRSREASLRRKAYETSQSGLNYLVTIREMVQGTDLTLLTHIDATKYGNEVCDHIF